MPVRSLNSSVMKWPKRNQVDSAVREWAVNLAKQCPEIEKVGYFGSYACGNWGVGSDLDVILLVTESDLPFYRRAVLYDATSLPVPTDLLVYTAKEWKDPMGQTRFVQKISKETIWVYSRSQ